MQFVLLVILVAILVLIGMSSEKICNIEPFVGSTGVWNGYTFTCTHGTCTGTYQGTPITHPIFVYKLKNGVNTFPGQSSNLYFNLYQNCSSSQICVDANYPLSPFTMFPERISDSNDRTLTVTQGSC